MPRTFPPAQCPLTQLLCLRGRPFESVGVCFYANIRVICESCKEDVVLFGSIPQSYLSFKNLPFSHPHLQYIIARPPNKRSPMLLDEMMRAALLLSDLCPSEKVEIAGATFLSVCSCDFALRT